MDAGDTVILNGVLEAGDGKMEVECTRKSRRKRRLKAKTKSNRPRIEWVESSAAALPSSRVRHKKFDPPSFTWRRFPRPI